MSSDKWSKSTKTKRFEALGKPLFCLVPSGDQWPAWVLFQKGTLYGVALYQDERALEALTPALYEASAIPNAMAMLSPACPEFSSEVLAIVKKLENAKVE